MVLHAGQNAQLTLNGNAAGVGQLDHLAGQLDIFLKRQRRTIDHNGSISAVHSSHAGINILAMVQVEGHGNGAVLGILLNSVCNVIGAYLLILQGAVGKICTASHEGIGQIRTLNDCGGAEHLMNLDHRLGLGHSVYIKSPLGVIVLLGCFQNRSHRYQRHNSYPPQIIN